MILESLKKLKDGKDLDEQQAGKLMESLLQEGTEPVQVSALLALLAHRFIRLSEFTGFVNTLNRLGKKIEVPGTGLVDMCGTGGDGKNTFNISTTSSFVAAAAGARVVKHGNYSASSACGASNVLEALGIPLHKEAEDLAGQFEAHGLSFLHAPHFQPLLRFVAPVRKKIGIRTFFNLLGPLLNPATPDFQLIGIPNLETFRLYNQFLEGIGRSFLLVHSLDGYDEISLTGRFIVKGDSFEASFEPEELGLKRCSAESLAGGTTPAESARILEDILAGKGSQEQSEVVVANAAFALLACDQSRDVKDCIAAARKALDSGQAHKLLKALV